VGELLKLVPPAKREPNQRAIEMVEGLLERVKSGEVCAVAFVQVEPCGDVGTAYASGDWHHQLASGAGRLAYRLVSVE